MWMPKFKLLMFNGILIRSLALYTLAYYLEIIACFRDYAMYVPPMRPILLVAAVAAAAAPSERLISVNKCFFSSGR